MVQSVELLVDLETDAWIWRQWRALEAAGLPSQVRHGSLTNWPHVTIGVAAAIPAEVDAALSSIATAVLPLPMGVGGVLWFPGKRHVIARAVVASTDLLRLHSQISAVMDALPSLGEHLNAGAWTPHITLARGVRTDQLPAVMTTLAAVPDLAQQRGAMFVACRRWDGERRITWEL